MDSRDDFGKYEPICDENSATKELQKELNIIRSLSENYTGIYYTNLKTRKGEVVSVHNSVKHDAGKMIEKQTVQKQENSILDALDGFIKNLVYTEDQPLIRNFLQYESMERLLAKKKKQSMVFRRNFDGVYKHVEITMVKAEAADEPPVNVAIGFAEIEERYRAEQAEKILREAYEDELREAKDRAEALNQAKTEFLFNMSHDIRTPMNAIIGFTNMALKNMEDKDKLSECLFKTKKAGNLLLSLINNILDMSRIEAGKGKLSEDPVDVTTFFLNAESTLFELAKSKDISLKFDLDGVRDHYVYCDFARCSRIFLNLITNAIKYTGKGGHVKVRLEQVSENVEGVVIYRYTVADDGIGMSEDFQPHAFEEFTREENSTVSGIQGTGLGLSVCKAFVDMMGGEISFKSKQGVGTTFVVELPLRLQENQAEREEDLSDEEDLALSGNAFVDKRVLVVEDNVLNREIVNDLLEEQGCLIEDAENGAEAVALLRKHGPRYYDYVLMDIQMPVMDGYEATKEIRHMYPEEKLPIIAVSANAFEEDKRKSLEVGMNAHIAKPIDADLMLQTMKKFDVS